VLSKITKKRWGTRVVRVVSKTAKKRWRTHVLRVLSRIAKKTVIVVVVIITHAIYSIYNIDMYICPGQLPPEQISVETINPVM
jgi:hypothetical protein